METFSSSILVRGRNFFPISFIKTWRKKAQSRFNIPNSRFALYPPLSVCSSPLSASTRFQISARSGRQTNRRNSRRRKLTELQRQHMHQSPIVNDPCSDFHSNFVNDSLEQNNRVSNSGVGEDLVESEIVDEPKSKLLGESVLWKKLEDWIDRYREDTQFWGIGSSPIFTVLQDSNGNTKRVDVNEDEILRRSQIDPMLCRKGGFEEFNMVNSKIAHAKFLAMEMENGKNVIPKSSSVAKFEVLGGQSGFVNVIQSISLRSGLLSRLGMTVMFSLLIFWVVKRLFTVGKDNVGYTKLEKEMLRRKIKMRKEREKLMKGTVEVIQNSQEPLIKPANRPVLDTQELMDSILKAKASNDKLSLPKGSGAEAFTFNQKIQEIRAMAKSARESERRDLSQLDANGKADQTVNEPFIEKEIVKEQQDGNQTVSNDLSNERLGSVTGKSDVPASSTSNIHALNDSKSTILDIKGAGIGLNLDNSIKEIQLSTTHTQGFKRIKPRIIKSVMEARDYLSRKHDRQEQDLERPTGAVEVDNIHGEANMTELEEKIQERLNKNGRVCGTSLSSEPTNSAFYTSASEDRTIKREEKCPEKTGYFSTAEELDEMMDQVPKFSLRDEGSGSTIEMGTTVSSLQDGEEMCTKRRQQLAWNRNSFQHSFIGGLSDSVPCRDSFQKIDENVPTCNTGQEDVSTLSDHAFSGRSTDTAKSMKENWMEKNFHELESTIDKIRAGFRDNYLFAREKEDKNLDMLQLDSNEDNDELEWMKDDRLREIVFKVRENEQAGLDPFYLMDDEDKLAFFEGLEKKVEKENEKLLNLHQYIHLNIENLDYGADGISLYDPPEKFIPRWKGPPVEKSPEFLNNFLEQKKALFPEKFGNSSHVKEDIQGISKNSIESPLQDDATSTTQSPKKSQDLNSKTSKTVIECSDGSVKVGKKSGKEYWQHTKKWSREFLESYNAETNPEVKAVLKDIGKDLDRWITEKEIQEAAELMDKIPERGRKFIKDKLNKVKREMELFGPQAVVSKYREYAEEKEEDYLWWLDLPSVLCIELYTREDAEMQTGFYSLEMAIDLELNPKQYHVIAFEDAGDCKNLCYIIQAHMEMLGIGNAFVVAQPPKDAFREAKANGFSVTVIRKGQLQLNVDQALEEVEEQIVEIGSKMYHDKIMQERSVDISSLMKGVFGSSKNTMRIKSKRKLTKPSKQ